MTWNLVSMSRTFSTSLIQRDVIHAHGHRGSNQKSTTVRSPAIQNLPKDRVVAEIMLHMSNVAHINHRLSLAHNNGSAFPIVHVSMAGCLDSTSPATKRLNERNSSMSPPMTSPST